MWLFNQRPKTNAIQQGMDASTLQGVINDIRSGNHNINSMLILHNGHLINETYFTSYNESKKNQIYSVTKSIISALIGIAIADRKIQSINQKLSEFFDEISERNLMSTITIRDLLSMTSGINWPEITIPYSDSEHPFNLMFESTNQIQYILERQMIDKPGRRFNYSTADSHLLSAILQRSVGMNVQEYAIDKLFNPIGITDTIWLRDKQGIPLGGTGLYLRSADMARFGLLYLQNGRWDNIQIIPSEWVEKSTVSYGYQYGYQWWIGTEGDYYGMGSKGQFIFVSPKTNLVVVFTGDLSDDYFPIRLYKDIKNSVNLK